MERHIELNSKLDLEGKLLPVGSYISCIKTHINLLVDQHYAHAMHKLIKIIYKLNNDKRRYNYLDFIANILCKPEFII